MMIRPPVCHYFQAGNCRNGEFCTFTHPSVKCRQFAATGWCPYGYNCHFLHGSQHTPLFVPPTGARKPCLFFANGQCKYGDRCTFSHDVKWELGSVMTLAEFKASKQRSKLTAVNRSGSPSEAVPTKLYSSSSDIRSPSHGGALSQQRAPVPRPGVHSGGTNASEVRRLQDLEIGRLFKHFTADKLQEAESCGDGRVFFLRFSSTDPDWAYDVREIVLSINIDRMYPVEPLKIAVLPKDYLPNTLVEHLNMSIQSWIASKHKQVRQTNRTEIYLRPFLQWLDRNLENLFTEGLRKYKRELFGDQPSSSSASTDRKAPQIDDEVKNNLVTISSERPPDSSDDSDDADSDGDNGHTDADSQEDSRGAADQSNTSNDESEQNVDDTSSETSRVDPFEDTTGQWVEPVQPETPETETEFNLDHELLSQLMKPSTDTRCTVPSATQQLCLNDFRLFGKAGTVVQRKLSVNMHCTRCRFQFTWVFSVCYNPDPGTESAGSSEQFTSVPPHTAHCVRCHQPMKLKFQATLLHAFTTLAGSFFLDGCVADDVPPKLSQFLLTCIECNKIVKLTGVENGQRVTKRCTVCHSLVGLEFSGIKLERVKGGESAAAPTGSTKTTSVETTKPSRKLRRAVNQSQNQFIQDGVPLPAYGTCKHYRKSHRWLRFPCCGRAEPCDVCHDESAVDGHEMEMASRMICGFCAKEQPFSNTKPCVRCGKQLTASRSAHWEGGKGCRNKVTMSRKDAKKYSQQNKTVPRPKGKL